MEKQSVAANTVSPEKMKTLPPNCLERQLGVQDKYKVLDTSIEASSEYRASTQMSLYPAKYARLYHLGNNWRPQKDDKTQFLQVDLGQVYIITAIATQGCNSEPWWVKSFQMQYSVDGKTFMDYMDPERKTLELVGNEDQNTIYRQKLAPIHARYTKSIYI